MVFISIFDLFPFRYIFQFYSYNGKHTLLQSNSTKNIILTLRYNFPNTNIKKLPGRVGCGFTWEGWVVGLPGKGGLWVYLGGVGCGFTWEGWVVGLGFGLPNFVGK